MENNLALRIGVVSWTALLLLPFKPIFSGMPIYFDTVFFSIVSSLAGWMGYLTYRDLRAYRLGKTETEEPFRRSTWRDTTETLLPQNLSGDDRQKILEWVRYARQRGRQLRLVSLPPMLTAIAGISEVGDVLRAAEG